MRVAGTHGHLARGTQVAADLGRWAIDKVTLTATVRSLHPYWAAQRPLDLTLDLGPRRIRWRGVEVVALTDTACTLTLAGAPEKD
jgi:hypothetical protein